MPLSAPRAGAEHCCLLSFPAEAPPPRGATVTSRNQSACETRVHSLKKRISSALGPRTHTCNDFNRTQSRCAPSFGQEPCTSEVPQQRVPPEPQLTSREKYASPELQLLHISSIVGSQCSQPSRFALPPALCAPAELSGHFLELRLSLLAETLHSSPPHYSNCRAVVAAQGTAQGCCDTEPIARLLQGWMGGWRDAGASHLERHNTSFCFFFLTPQIANTHRGPVQEHFLLGQALQITFHLTPSL